MTKLGNDRDDIALRLCEVLDPLMTSCGFQPGQAGASPSEVGIVYCSPHVDFRARFPNLATDIDYSDDGACTDLNIYVALGATPHLREVHLDGHSLEELLRDIDRSDLDPAVASLPRLQVEEGAERLRTVLTAVFARPSQLSTTGEEDS